MAIISPAISPNEFSILYSNLSFAKIIANGVTINNNLALI